ncbi:hypothetical protein Q3G72_015669 [Acer saccharum]|nr:hypothetical protein Q3G72_015669 [Acer saccharum]
MSSACRKEEGCVARVAAKRRSQSRFCRRRMNVMGVLNSMHKCTMQGSTDTPHVFDMTGYVSDMHFDVPVGFFES